MGRQPRAIPRHRFYPLRKFIEGSILEGNDWDIPEGGAFPPDWVGYLSCVSEDEK
jgi:hypothetical protein